MLDLFFSREREISRPIFPPQVLLQSPIASEVQSSNTVVPSSVLFGGQGAITWTWTPTEGTSMHYQLGVSGRKTPGLICAQNAVPNQPPNTCVVAFAGATNCYMGYVPVVPDFTLQPIPTPSATSPAPSSSNVVAIAVAVPISVVCVAALAAVAFVVYRKRQAAAADAAASAAAGDLAAPLATASNGSMARESHEALFERAPSDIQIRLPSASPR